MRADRQTGIAHEDDLTVTNLPAPAHDPPQPQRRRPRARTLGTVRYPRAAPERCCRTMASRSPSSSRVPPPESSSRLRPAVGMSRLGLGDQQPPFSGGLSQSRRRDSNPPTCCVQGGRPQGRNADSWKASSPSGDRPPGVPVRVEDGGDRVEMVLACTVGDRAIRAGGSITRPATDARFSTKSCRAVPLRPRGGPVATAATAKRHRSQPQARN